MDSGSSEGAFPPRPFPNSFEQPTKTRILEEFNNAKKFFDNGYKDAILHIEKRERENTEAHQTIKDLQQQLTHNKHPEPHRHSAEYPHPERFDDGPSKFRSWLLDVRLKLHFNADYYVSEQFQMAFVYSRLIPAVQDYMHEYVDGIHFEFNTLEDMFKYLSDNFG